MAKTYQQIMDEARKVVPEVTADEVKSRVDRGAAGTLLDVREKEEVRQGYIPGALSIPRGFLEMQVEEKLPDKSAPIVAYCAGGTRSLLAGRILKELGYTNVVSMKGGFGGWKNKGLPVQEDKQFTAEQQIRYSRHFLLPEVGEKGQAKLLGAKVLCVGAGGLGSPVALYLAAAGVGTIGLVDMDVVDLSNLQRQILHTNDRVGMLKTESAKITLNALNPDVKVIEHRERLSSENAVPHPRRLRRRRERLRQLPDPLPRQRRVRALEEAARRRRDLAVRGAGHGVRPVEGRPVLPLLLPRAAAAGAVPSCAEAGVLGVLPGIVGCVQALEAIKIILGEGKTLLGRMMHFDTLAGEVRTLKIRRDPKCAVCGDHPTVKELVDYEFFCGLGASDEPAHDPLIRGSAA
jgi:molybdopterin/thiamine biosynthesis adenylyltransferase/rhodanese-related sulfurtransferase